MRAAAPYVLPFVVFALWLVAAPHLPLAPRLEAIARVASLLLVIAWALRQLPRLRFERPAASTAFGVAIFVVWVLPDLLIPGYRSSWLFSNGLVGTPDSSLAPAVRGDPLILTLRFARAALIVPVVEELFWRGWLPRWLDRMEDFQAVPLGSFSRFSFWAVAVLFALEHGSFWEVGLVAGIGYNWWMSRTRSLGDLMLSHGVTNACLSCYVLWRGQWQYW
jgi:CAAX prenyl protease-like protein